MTRINLVDPKDIPSKYLLAEYKELPRLSKFAEKYNGSIPEHYCLGAGHVKFFVDKGEFLRRRFEDEIVPELQRRGFKLNYTKYRMHPEGKNNDWQPSDTDKMLNMQRILERIFAKINPKEFDE